MSQGRGAMRRNTLRFEPEEAPLKEKVQYVLVGAGLIVSLQLGYALYRAIRSRPSQRRGAGSNNGNGNGSSSSQARMLSPLHHLDFQTLKARSSASSATAFARSTEQGDSPIFQVVLTGGPSGGKSR